jgi:threonylcarbamoyladenosine tRNA methylthiotransferase MtaB
MQYFSKAFEGTVRPVLFEQTEKGEMMEGYTDNYIRVSTPYRSEWVNQLIDWKL